LAQLPQQAGGAGRIQKVQSNTRVNVAINSRLGGQMG